MLQHSINNARKCDLSSYTWPETMYHNKTTLVCRRLGQVVVHAGTLLVRRLLHHTALVRIALPGSHLDWIACYASITANVNSGHIAILEFAQNLQLNQIVAAYFHCHICLANSSWPDSFIREFRRFIGLYALAFNILLGMRLFPNRNHVHSWLRRHLLYNGTRARLYRLVHPHWLGKLFLSVLFLPLYLFLFLRSLALLSYQFI